MFKKIMLATAITAVSGGALAASWDSALTTAVTHNAEGIEQEVAAAGFEISNAVLTIGAELGVNDTITFTYNVDKATNANWPTSLYSRNVGAAGVTLEAKGISAASQANITSQTANDSNTAAQTGVVLGDRLTIASSGTQVYTVTDLLAGTANTFAVTPTLTTATVDNETLTFLNQTISFVTFGLQSSTANSVTYRVLSIADGSTTVGAQVATPAINMQVAGATSAGAVTVTYAAATSAGAAVDAFATSATVATIAKQQTLTITKKLDGVVDVEADKKSLAGKTADTNGADTATDNAAGASFDAIIVDYATVAAATGTAVAIGNTGTVSLDAGVAALASTLGSAVTVIDGDFTWMDSAAAAGTTITAGAVTGAQVNTDAMATTGQELTVTQTTLSADQAILLKADQAAKVLPITSWSGKTTVTYTPATGAAATEVYTWADLGQWTLNGATVTAYGVPMGSSVSRFLWVNNAGTADAALTYTITMNGTSYGPHSIGTVAAKSASSVAGLIDTDLTARSIYVAPSSRANITLTSQVKAADITVSAAYKHIGDADRLTIETSDSIDGTAK
ncbi:hypothetical protein OAC48_03165 [Porticoccaceae bacterium]|nr:hypothetical protein [Porticoccaceae bacterium]